MNSTNDDLVKVGFLGLDMSHAVEFAARLNDPTHPEYVAGMRVTVGWPGGSKDFELSWSRVEKFTFVVREKYGVRIVDSPEAVAREVDLVLITAADARAHRELFERVAPFARPTFIEKPITISLTDAKAIFSLAEAKKIAVMSCSTARFGEPLEKALSEDLGVVIGCDVFGPMPEEATQPGLFWYGVHSIEVINVIMGRGCREVRAFRNDDCDLMTGVWEDGRVATFRGLRKGAWKFGAAIHREKGFQFVDLIHNSWFKPTIERMLSQLMRGQLPVAQADTLEIIQIIESANVSRQTGGVCSVS